MDEEEKGGRYYERRVEHGKRIRKVQTKREREEEWNGESEQEIKRWRIDEQWKRNRGSEQEKQR